MTDKSILFQAKSFLCWDKFPDLSIKLIPIKKPVAFFYAPGNLSSIVLFYFEDDNDTTEPLCFLFHEAGHYIQWKLFQVTGGSENEYQKIINMDKGFEKLQFELQAWIRGKGLLENFLEKEKIEKKYILKKYNKLQEISLDTYQSK